MPRHDYPLTPETIKVMTGNAQQIAEEAGYRPSYAYAITEAKVTDPFSVFVHLYAAAVRAGCNITPWITRLKLIEEKYRPLQKNFCVQKEVAEFVTKAGQAANCHSVDEDLEKKLAEQQRATAESLDVERALRHAINERDAKNLYNGRPVSTDTRQRTVQQMRRTA